MRKTLYVSLMLLAAACGGGGGSGISDSAVVIELSAEQQMDLCNELAADYPPREVDCSGTTITLGIDPADCDQPADYPDTCQVTAGDLRDCFAAIDALSDEQICTQDAPPAACEPLFSAECTGA